MRTYLKVGGLGLSAVLTLSLFVRLFGMGAYGLVLAFAALALFEGGAFAWHKLLDEAKNEQRSIAKAAQWFCLISSITSSGAEIILSTGLWKPPFDLAFTTLCIIVAALAVNVIGVFAFDNANPSTQAKHRELDRQAKASRQAETLQDQVIEQSLIKAEAEVGLVSGNISGVLAGHIKDQVTAYLLARTLNASMSATGSALNAGRPETPIPATAWPTAVGARHDAEAPASPVLADTAPKAPSQ